MYTINKPAYRSIMPLLPPEVFARIDCLYNLKRMEEQKDFFSELIPISKQKALRWRKPMKCLPCYHRIDMQEQGKRITVDVLSHDHRRVLTVQCENGAWRLVTAENLKAFAKEKDTYYQNCQWHPKPASTSQVSYIAKLLATAPDELPTFSAYNAGLIIDSSRMMKHWRRIGMLYAIWISELRRQEPNA